MVFSDKTRIIPTSRDLGEMTIEEMGRESEPTTITMSLDVPLVCVRDGGGHDDGVCQEWNE
jgi:hypothetical protein